MGDVGRSPRMQYHSLSLARQNTRVTLVGLGGSRCIPEVQSSPLIKKHIIRPFTLIPRGLLPFALWAPLKVLAQTARLLRALLIDIERPDAILLQVPPSMPTLIVLGLVSAVSLLSLPEITISLLKYS